MRIGQGLITSFVRTGMYWNVRIEHVKEWTGCMWVRIGPSEQGPKKA